MLEQSTSTHRIDGNPTCLRALHSPFRLLWLVTAFSTMFLAFVSIPHAFIISMVSNLTPRWAGNRANVRRCLGQAFVSSTRTCVIYKHGLLSRVKVFLYFIEKQFVFCELCIRSAKYTIGLLVTYCSICQCRIRDFYKNANRYVSLDSL